MAGMNGSNIVTQNPGETTSRPTLFVLGMHRSGTSAITGALRLCGAWVGDETELTDANAENPLGFWERRDMRDLCDRMLHSAGADWWKIADFDPKAIPRVELAEQRQEFEKIVSVLDKYEAWVIKEPRLCLLLPVLRHYVKNPVCIHIYRNPLEVARSLQTRNRFSISAGLALWEVYNLHALNASEGLPRISLSYESFMLHPLETLDALVKELEGLATGHPIKPDRGLIERFIDESLYHQRATDEETEDYLLPSQRALWLRLRSGEVFDDHKDIPISEATRQSLLDLESVEVSLRLHEDRTGELEASLRKYTALLKDRDRRISNMEASTARLRTNLEERTATLKVRDKKIKSMEASAARLRTNLKARDEKIKDLEGVEARLRTNLKARDKTIDDLYNSTSWKITAPLRALSRGVRWLLRILRRAPSSWLSPSQISRAMEAVRSVRAKSRARSVARHEDGQLAVTDRLSKLIREHRNAATGRRACGDPGKVRRW